MSWLKSVMEKEPPEPKNPLGVLVIGNLEPDMHDAPKETVRRSLKRAGFKTIDVGKNVAPKVFIDKVKENRANLLVLSINTLAAKNNLQMIAETLKVTKLTDKLTIIIGGAAVKKEDADKFGAFFGKDKDEAVKIAKKAINKKITSES